MIRARITYQPGASFLHRLHPLTKLAWLGVGTALLFVLPSPWLILGALALVLLAYAASGLRLSGVRGVRLLAFTSLFLGALQLLLVREGPVLLRLGPLAPTTRGLAAAVYVAGRFLGVVLLSYLFVLSTDPSDLAYALVRAGLPYRYGFALVTALRLVPVFEGEAQIVYSAQLARGLQYDVRSPRRFLALARQFFLPLLVSALGKVDALAVSMEGRCFGKYQRRTFLRQTDRTRLDGAALLLLATLCLAVVAARLLLP